MGKKDKKDKKEKKERKEKKRKRSDSSDSEDERAQARVRKEASAQLQPSPDSQHFPNHPWQKDALKILQVAQDTHLSPQAYYCDRYSLRTHRTLVHTHA